MQIIKLSCPQCGEVDLTAEKIRLQLWGAVTRNNYRFECPTCGRTVVKPATTRMLGVLRSQGVGTDLDDCPPDPDASAFRPDDLLDFHLALQSDERIAAFLASASLSDRAGSGRAREIS